MNQRNTLHLERLFTLLLSGAYGVILTWMFISNYYGWTRGERTLISLVTPWIQFMIFLGGVFLLIQFFILLFTFRLGGDGHHHDHNEECCDHDHNHDHEHEHQHEGHEHHLHDLGQDDDHSHNHGHEHSHEHGEACCDHGHDHGWNPIRYVPLLIPVILYFMGLPSDQMIRNFERNLAERATKDSATDLGSEEAKSSFAVMVMSSMGGPFGGGSFGENTPYSLLAFWNALGSGITAELDDAGPNEPAFVTNLAELEKAAQSPTLRAEFTQKRKVEIDGMFQPEGKFQGGMMFQIVRLRMACCLSDARPSTVACFTKKTIDERLLQGGHETKWARAQGKLRFVRGKDGKYEPIMKAYKVEWAPFPPFPYIS